jgi:enamine deaminase RidA (YjgF/YER057c/UK114 family)
MSRQWISSGSVYETQIGYSRAVVEGDWVFVSGTTGFDYATMTIADDVAMQAEQCLQNIATALKQACRHDDCCGLAGPTYEDRD